MWLCRDEHHHLIARSFDDFPLVDVREDDSDPVIPFTDLHAGRMFRIGIRTSSDGAWSREVFRARLNLVLERVVVRPEDKN